MARVRLFASLRESAGVARDFIVANSVAELLEIAKSRYGAEFSEALGFASVAVNGLNIGELNGTETPLTADDEVALLPPVSGGAGLILPE